VSLRALEPTDVARHERDRRARAEHHVATFWEALGRLAAVYGVEVVVRPDRRRAAARWDGLADPPRLLAASVRFERPGAGHRRRVPAERDGRELADRRALAQAHAYAPVRVATSGRRLPCLLLVAIAYYGQVYRLPFVAGGWGRRRRVPDDQLRGCRKMPAAQGRAALGLVRVPEPA
jgi:hypothetical protein